MKTRPPSRHAVTFVFITVFLDMAGFGLIIPVLPKLIQTLGHLDVGAAASISGWMFLGFSAASFLFGPTMGNLSDAYGRRPLLLLAVAGLFGDYLLMSFAPSLLWLFVGRAFAGLCGSSYVIANAYLADITTPENRAKAFGLMGAAFGLGFVVGPAIGGLLGTFGPRVPFYVAAGISALNLVYGYFVIPETLAPEKRRAFDWRRANPFGTFKVFQHYKGVVPLCFVLFVYFFASSIYQAIWPFWGIAKFGWSELVIGFTLAAFGIVTAIFQGAFSGPLVKRFGERRLVLLGLAIATIVVAGYGLSTGLGLVVVLIIMHGPEGFVHPMLTAIMSKAVPEDAQGELQGGISSIMNVALLMGTLFFAQVFGYFMRPGGALVSPDVSYFVSAIILAISLILFVWSGQAQANTAPPETVTPH